VPVLAYKLVWCNLPPARAAHVAEGEP
jgi:hypothetical protein